MRKKPPCKDCPPEVRPEACHVTCEKYITWKKEREAFQEEVYEKKNRYTIHSRKIQNRIEKIRKR